MEATTINAYQLYGLIGLAVIGLIVAAPKVWSYVASKIPDKQIAAGSAPVSEWHAGSDNAPPLGAVAWVSDMVKAAGVAADPKFVLDQLSAGHTKAQLMEARIAQLEGNPK